MAISDRIDSIEQHLKESYQELEGIGIDTSEVDNNLKNIPKLIDGYWQTLPKVTGEGTSITLDNTKEGKMGIIYKGNTYQYSTTGKQLLVYPYKETTKTSNGITFTDNGDGSITINGTATGTANFVLKETGSSIDNGDYSAIIYSDVLQDYYFVTGSSNSGISYNSNLFKTFTVTNNTMGYCLIQVTQGKTLNNVTIRPMLVKGTYTRETIGDYEPYTNGASPNPDYPQEIQVVSGDNEVEVVGKNLVNVVDNNKVTYSSSYNNFTISNNEISTTGNTLVGFKVKVVPNSQYIASASETATTGANSLRIREYSEEPTNWNDNYITQYSENFSNGVAENTITTDSNTKWVLVVLYSNTTNKFSNIQFEVGNVKSTYEAYKGASYPINLPEGMELCKIGTYQDRIFKSSGKNLIDFTTITYTTDNGATASRSGEEYTVNATGSKWASVRFSQDYLNLKPNTTYTFSATIKSTTSSGGSMVIVYAGGNSTGSNVNGTTATAGNRSYATFTTPNEISGKVLGLVVYEENKTAIFTDIMLEESASATTYEPYGTGWYLNKQIGKVVLDGSETWTKSTVFYSRVLSNLINQSYSNGYTNNFRLTNSWGNLTGSLNTFALSDWGNDRDYNAILINANFNNITDFKTWLSTHNTEVYYVVSNPTYTGIEGTLKEQLEAIKTSYENQTNISQENNDLASVLNASALQEM